MSSVREVIASRTGAIDRGLGLLRADDIIDALHAAGFRIIGKDEVDPVTLEKAADAAEEQAEWVPLKAGDMRAAILAIGRKA